jgi:hypothetical protein
MFWIFHPAAVNFGSISHSERDGDGKLIESADELSWKADYSNPRLRPKCIGSHDAATTLRPFLVRAMSARKLISPGKRYRGGVAHWRTDIAVALWCHCRDSSRALTFASQPTLFQI